MTSINYESWHLNMATKAPIVIFTFNFRCIHSLCNRFPLSSAFSKVFMSSSFNWDLYGVHFTRAIKLSNSHHLFSKWIFRNFHRIFNKWLEEKEILTAYWTQNGIFWHMFNIKAQHSLTHRHELPHEGINAEQHKCTVSLMNWPKHARTNQRNACIQSFLLK